MKISDLVMNKINASYVLPSIQREFVWLRNPKERKVEKLFDSILQEYPFGTILTWQVKKETQANKLHWEVYQFVQDYDADSPHNKVASVNGFSELSLVLDGQQRLTSLFLGLRGSFSYTSYGKRRVTKLYLNLVSDIENDPDNNYGLKYEFVFLENPKDDADHVWFEVGKVLDYHDRNAEHFKLGWESHLNTRISDPDKLIRAKINLGQLHACICGSDDVLKIAPFQTDDDEKVLNVFVRTNDGGIKLEKADLLLSYMESNNSLFPPLGARKEILNFTDSLNAVTLHRPSYKLGMDDILKASLVLSDLEVQYKLRNFNEPNLVKLSGNWESIKKYLSMTVDLLARYGFSSKNILSNNGLIPIAYYLQKRHASASFIASQAKADLEEKNEIIRWLVLSQLTGAFGSSSDTTLKKVRDDLNRGKSFKQINLGKIIDREDVEKWIDRESYNSRYSHLLLLLASDSRYWDACHQDHIYPLSSFNSSKYTALGLDQDMQKFYEEHANSIANIHLLNPSVNIVKSNDEFIDWAAKQNARFIEASMIPGDVDYSFNNFPSFIAARKSLMIESLYARLKG